MKAKLFCRKKKVKKVANSGELRISFAIAARPCTVGRCGMIPVLKSQEPSESLVGFVHTDRVPNGSGSDRSSVHTETAIRIVYPAR